MSNELTEECGNCKNARELLAKLNNAAGGCYYLGWLHAVAGDQSRGSKSPFNGPLELMCHTCGAKGSILSRTGSELVELVRQQLLKETGEWAPILDVAKATYAVAVTRSLPAPPSEEEPF